MSAARDRSARGRPVAISPDCASLTLSAQLSSRRRANISVNPSGMCCTTTMHPGKSRRQLRQDILQRLRAAGGNPDGNDLGRLAFAGIELCFRRVASDSSLAEVDLNAAALGSGLDFGDQLASDLRHAGRNISWAWQRSRRRPRPAPCRVTDAPLSAVRTDHDYRHTVAPHDLLAACPGRPCRASPSPA